MFAQSAISSGFKISLVGSVIIFSLAYLNNTPFPCPLPTLVCPVITGTEKTEKTDFMDFGGFFFFFYNERIIALLCSSFANHQTPGKTNWSLLQIQEKCFSLVWDTKAERPSAATGE